MIRSRAAASSGNGNGGFSSTVTSKKRALVAGKRKDARKKSPSFFLILFGIMMLIMGVYCMVAFHAMSLMHGTTNSQGGNNPKTHAATKPQKHVVIPGSPNNPKDQASRKLLADIRKRFDERYKVEHDGGKTILNGEKLLEKGLRSFGSIESTARRILDAAEAQRPFVMAYSGYSITVGRGNFYNQSFPFVAGRILEQPLREIFGIPLTVRNAAIGGIPSFPYAFCLDHFLGTDPDVVSWDYLMNEQGKDPSIFEAFVRQVTNQLPNKPMVIMVETNAARMKMLHDYTQKGWLDDAIAIGKKDVLDLKAIFGKDSDPTPEENLPTGFQQWNEFGSPKRCPGRGAWHPKKQEHAMMGWMIAMYFIEAMEKAIELREKDKTPGSLARQKQQSSPNFSKPLSSKLPVNDQEVTELLFGHPKSNNENELIMKQLSCRTSFLPATDHSKTLPSVVVSGMAEGDLDIMVDRTDEHYKEGWVLDVSKVERDTKRKVESCGGLGYVDMKIALYGVPESGKIRLWLPFEGPSHDHHDHDGADKVAKHWFDDFVLCEANDKRDEKACKLDRDLELIVGGVEVAAENIHPLKGAAEYLKRPTCVNVGIPPDAEVTPLGEVCTMKGEFLSAGEKAKFGNYGDDALGILVDVTAKSSVSRKNGACCLSHIVWEQH